MGCSILIKLSIVEIIGIISDYSMVIFADLYKINWEKKHEEIFQKVFLPSKSL